MKARAVGGRFRAALRTAELLLSSHRLYCLQAPSEQNAVDIFAGEWTTALPIAEVNTGEAFRIEEDRRVAWAVEKLGSVRGKRVLELGPLEAGHTWLLEQQGADVLGIEANERAFLRCLIAKNALRLRAQFLLGDFGAFLATDQSRFDLIFASGVLYHLADPAQVLLHMASRADRLFLWSHFYDAEAVAAHPKLSRDFAKGPAAAKVSRGGVEATYHYRVYGPGALTRLMPGFCGGMTTTTVWLTLPDIEAIVRSQGLEVCGLEVQRDHPHGPAFQLAARRA